MLAVDISYDPLAPTSVAEQAGTTTVDPPNENAKAFSQRVSGNRAAS